MNWQVLVIQTWAHIPPFIEMPAVTRTTQTGFIWTRYSITSTRPAASREAVIPPGNSRAGNQLLENRALGTGLTLDSSRPRSLALIMTQSFPVGTLRLSPQELQPCKLWSPPPPKCPTRPTSPLPWNTVTTCGKLRAFRPVTVCLRTPRCPSTQKPWTFQPQSPGPPLQQGHFLWKFQEIAGPSDPLWLFLKSQLPPGHTKQRPGMCAHLDWGLQSVTRIESAHSVAMATRTFKQQASAQRNIGVQPGHGC